MWPIITSASGSAMVQSYRSPDACASRMRRTIPGPSVIARTARSRPPKCRPRWSRIDLLEPVRVRLARRGRSRSRSALEHRRRRATGASAPVVARAQRAAPTRPAARRAARETSRSCRRTRTRSPTPPAATPSCPRARTTPPPRSGCRTPSPASASPRGCTRPARARRVQPVRDLRDAVLVMGRRQTEPANGARRPSRSRSRTPCSERQPSASTLEVADRVLARVRHRAPSSTGSTRDPRTARPSRPHRTAWCARRVTTPSVSVGTSSG